MATLAALLSRWVSLLLKGHLRFGRFKLPTVNIRMTEGALFFRVIIGLCTIGMTPITRLVHMSAPQSKSSDPVVKSSLEPPHWRVTIFARCLAKACTVRTLVLMAISAAHIERLIIAPSMTLGTFYLPMASLQGEAAHAIVIEFEVAPRKPGLLMATITTLPTKLTPMGIDMTPDAIILLGFPPLP